MKLLQMSNEIFGRCNQVRSNPTCTGEGDWHTPYGRWVPRRYSNPLIADQGLPFASSHCLIQQYG